jgi:23S rRNA pseudouridine1911/1915/1917 synthase
MQEEGHGHALASVSRVFDGASKERLDKVVAELFPTLSRSWVKSNIGKGLVRVNGVVASKAGQNVKRGDTVTVEQAVVENKGAQVRSQAAFVLEPNAAVVLRVLYEDAEVVVLDKPKGMVVHPSRESGRNFGDSLCNGLVARYGLVGLAPSEDGTRPGIVHRLDVETSGVMVVARTAAAYKVLHDQFATDKKSMQRNYVAIVAGGFPKGASGKSGTVDAPIGRHPKHGTKRCVRAPGDASQAKMQHVKSAVTHWRVELDYGEVAVVRCVLETGRTHQIRVHMKHARHPLLCDPLYGPGNMPCAAQELRLQRILDAHNVSGELLQSFAVVCVYALCRAVLACADAVVCASQWKSDGISRAAARLLDRGVAAAGKARGVERKRLRV